MPDIPVHIDETSALWYNRVMIFILQSIKARWFLLGHLFPLFSDLRIKLKCDPPHLLIFVIFMI